VRRWRHSSLNWLTSAASPFIASAGLGGAAVPLPRSGRRRAAMGGDIRRPKKPKRLSAVLTVDEVRRVFAHVDGVHGLMARLVYGARPAVHGFVCV
jgi:hypothetical protein